MKPSNFNHITVIQAILALLCVILFIILLIQIASESSLPDGGSIAVTKSETTAAGQKKAEVIISDINNYNAMIERPLFNEDRKPYVYAQPIKEEKEVPKLTQEFSLTAVVITPEKSIAILQSSNSKTLQRVALGEKIDNWTISEIHDQSVVLEQGGQTRIVELEVKGSNKTKKQTSAQKTTEQPLQTTTKEEIQDNAGITEPQTDNFKRALTP